MSERDPDAVTRDQEFYADMLRRLDEIVGELKALNEQQAPPASETNYLERMDASPLTDQEYQELARKNWTGA